MVFCLKLRIKALLELLRCIFIKRLIYLLPLLSGKDYYVKMVFSRAVKTISVIFLTTLLLGTTTKSRKDESLFKLDDL